MHFQLMHSHIWAAAIEEFFDVKKLPYWNRAKIRLDRLGLRLHIFEIMLRHETKNLMPWSVCTRSHFTLQYH